MHSKDMFRKFLKLKLWQKALLVVIFSFVVFVAWFIYAIVTDEPPHFFPLNNSQGKYTITKNCPNGQGWREQFSGQGYAYCVEYKGADVFMNDESGNTNFFRITVGKSAIDLEPLIGKEVKSIEGKYVGSRKQCIQDKCVDIGGPYVVLDVNSSELVDE